MRLMGIDRLNGVADFPLVAETLDRSILLDPVPAFLVLEVVHQIETVIGIIVTDIGQRIPAEIHQVVQGLVHPLVHGTPAADHLLVEAGRHVVALGSQVHIGPASAGKVLYPFQSQVQDDGRAFLLHQDVLEDGIQIKTEVPVGFAFETDLTGLETQGIHQIRSVEVIAVNIGYAGPEKGQICPCCLGIGLIISLLCP